MKVMLSMLPCLASSQSLACFSLPAGQGVWAQTLLGSDRTVLLARVRAAAPRSDGTVRYDFTVEKQFFGKPTEAFSIDGSIAPMHGGDIFTDHRDGQFWRAQGAKVSNDTDCKVHPDFVIGGTYLVFPDAPFTRKSFERIVRVRKDAEIKDKWLAYVEDYFFVPR